MSAAVASATAVCLTGGDLSKSRPVEIADVLAGTKAWPGDLVVVFLGRDEQDPAVSQWIPDAAVVKSPRGWEVRWKPGRAVIRGAVKIRPSLLSAAARVEAADRQLREMDAAISPVEAVAAGDVDFAYTISVAHRSRWKRFDRTIKDLYQVRLKLARFDPAGSADLDPRARQAVQRLSARVRFDDRSEVLSDRLEAVEDLYEGAVDRIVDHRWYVVGITIETLIVVLLAAETLLLLLRPGR